MSEPTWIGVGAQRAGTTWLTDLLLQHPDLALNRLNRKELHYFDRFGVRPWTSRHAWEYRLLFGHNGGEFTPAYLRLPWVPHLIRATAPEALILVVLRDPIERFASAMRWYDGLRRRRLKTWRGRHVRDRGADAAWGGMYGDQLALWHGLQVEIVQYEQAILDPQHTVDGIWARLGLTPVELTGVTEASRTTTSVPYEWPEGLRDSLRRLYAGQAPKLEDRVDLSLWPTFS